MSKFPYKSEYVIQLHKARRAGDHYDLRIKYKDKNALASFALPKAKFPNYGEKILAIRTPDHSIKEWLGPHDPIEDCKYGAGTFELIDQGRMEILGWSNRLITFKINKGKFEGKYSLIRVSYTKTKSRRRENTWIFVKSKEKLQEIVLNYVNVF